MGNTPKEQHTLLTDYETHSAYSEAIRSLFATIRFQWEEKPTRSHSLLITTPYAYGDFPALAANLAIVAAQSGAPTVLVDANLRAPIMQQRFGLEKTTGLSDLLQDSELTHEKVASALQSTFVPGLQILGAGTQMEQGAALLLSTRLSDIVDALCQQTDGENNTEKTERIVLFHSPAVLAGPDASLIGTLVDQVVLAIISNRTTRAQAKLAQEQLHRARAKLAGIVMVSM